MEVQFHNPFLLPQLFVVLTASEGSKIFLSGLCIFSFIAHMAHTRLFPPPCNISPQKKRNVLPVSQDKEISAL
jgi:hypothetical protein